MTIIYNFEKPQDMTDAILTDIVADLLSCAGVHERKGNLVNANKLQRAGALVVNVIERNSSEENFEKDSNQIQSDH